MSCGPRLVVQQPRPQRVVVSSGSTQVVVRDPEAVVEITHAPTPTIAVNDSPSVTVARSCVRTVALVTPGPQGPPGETEGATFLAEAGEAIHGRRIVRVVDGRIYHPDRNDSTHAGQCIGLSLQAGSTGALLLVRTGGQHTDSSWAFEPGPVWCGDDGVLTQSQLDTGWVLKVGVAVNPTTVEIDLDDPFLRN